MNLERTLSRTNLTKGLLLVSLLAAMAGASAAELPTMRSEPVKNAKRCNIAGMEGFLLPGSNVCVKASGYVTGGVAAGNVK
jgi:hypothetical protein